MPRLKLTDSAVARLKSPPPPKQVDYWDLLAPGFGIRVNYSGTKTWITQRRVLQDGKWRQSRIRLGRYPLMSLAEARNEARKFQILANEGQDPRTQVMAERQLAVEESKKTFAMVRERFIRQHCEKSLRASTVKQYHRILTSKDFRQFEHRAIGSITRREVIEAVDLIAERAPVEANRCFACLRAMMNWAASKDLIDTPPTDRVKAPSAETPRDRVLSHDEIVIAWKAFDLAGAFAPLLKILLLTGQRKTEVAEMRWTELKDLDGPNAMWEIPKERVKMDRPHRVPLTPLTVQIIKRIPKAGTDFVFSTNGMSPVSGFSRMKEILDRNIRAIAHSGAFEKEWVIHDLRRTVATNMAEMGVSRDVVELILNHQSGTRSGVAGIYNRSELLPERRKALESWANALGSLVLPERIPLRIA